MKAIKRNAVIITVMLFVCAAVYLNWSYNSKVDKASTAGDGVSVLEESGGKGSDTDPGKSSDTDSGKTLENLSPDSGAGLYYSVAGDGGADGKTGSPDSPAGDSPSADTPSAETPAAQSGDYAEYFAQVRLERSQARDEAAATLSAVAEAEGASKETVDGALKAMTELAQNAVKESELESLIRAKGFIDCVVYLSDGGARVTVAADGGLNQASVAKITDVIVSQGGIPASQLTVTEIK